MSHENYHKYFTRILSGLGFFICMSALSGAFYLQHIVGLQPCPLCILQRMVFIGLAIIFFIHFILDPKIIGQRIDGALIVILSSLGIFFAGRQVWLQHLPPEARPECGPSFDFLIQNFPLQDAFSYILTGSGECATVDWTFLGQG